MTQEEGEQMTDNAAVLGGAIYTGVFSLMVCVFIRALLFQSVTAAAVSGSVAAGMMFFVWVMSKMGK